MVYHCNRGELAQREAGPLPCWSVLTDDCIARGRDITDCGAVYNYHSGNDSVLKYLYAAAQGGQTAAGSSGFTASGDKLKNINVSDVVNGHSEYHNAVGLH